MGCCRILEGSQDTAPIGGITINKLSRRRLDALHHATEAENTSMNGLLASV